ncbi:uncharacterized protein MELLADRAFT_101317 [Melampsora larici-populina 98AG31]|uniref:Uncharacterized protein n=1 Tax=Melampsora larici-populina (strain 98AG31 / pathotype 3-4-7) TaxID=747676 RepID=F4R4C1_MELLP|nr:uncharacterized protein MELLADRAFT_101317 [Melampsora larici-populina 98AG31]EGG12785.1 hypothetical protein MELLADRAFT_101317 [Melampsora larici-populina 98AG31]
MLQPHPHQDSDGPQTTPTSFDTTEIGMSGKVIEIVRDLADNTCSQLQAQLLHNISPPLEPNPAVPQLQSLISRPIVQVTYWFIKHIVQSSNEEAEPLSKVEIWKHTDKEDKAQISLLSYPSQYPVNVVPCGTKWIPAWSGYPPYLRTTKPIFDGVWFFASIENENTTTLNLFEELDWEELFEDIDSKQQYKLGIT